AALAATSVFHDTMVPKTARQQSGSFGLIGSRMQVSGTGAGVGALLGALGRALVVICWLGPQAGIIALPSAGIGLLVGAIAGSLGRPLRGALVGFVLSAFVFELFMCACASVLGTLEASSVGRTLEWHS